MTGSKRAHTHARSGGPLCGVCFCSVTSAGIYSLSLKSVLLSESSVRFDKERWESEGEKHDSSDNCNCGLR